MKTTTATGAIKTVNRSTEGLSLSDIKSKKPVRSHAGYIRCWIGPDKNGRDQWVLLRPDEIETKGKKYKPFHPESVVTR